MIRNDTNLLDYRYERKFFISDLSRYEIEQIIKLHPAVFSEIYYQRFVNNIYFDTVNMVSYVSNIHGISQRTKTRIRWYGELFGLIEKPVLELKIKQGFLGTKRRFPLASFILDNNYSQALQQGIFSRSDIPAGLAEDLKLQKCSLLNRYSRIYYESRDKNFRITIDFDMESYRINPANNTFTEKIVDHHNVVLELKYSQENDEKARFITNYFPFRMKKSSKYATGIERVYPHIY